MLEIEHGCDIRTHRDSLILDKDHFMTEDIHICMYRCLQTYIIQLCITTHPIQRKKQGGNYYFSFGYLTVLQETRPFFFGILQNL